MTMKKLLNLFNSSTRKSASKVPETSNVNKSQDLININDDFEVIKKGFEDLNIDITDKSVAEITKELDKRLLNQISLTVKAHPDLRGQHIADKFLGVNENHNIVILKAHVDSLKVWLESNTEI